LDEHIGSRIEELLNTLNLKKVHFADQLKIDQSYVTQLTNGRRKPSDRLIDTICIRFNVNEVWLRTGKGEMFIEKTTSEEIAAFVGDALTSSPDFRKRFLSVLSRMTPDEWRILENKVLELAGEIKKADPEGPADPGTID